MLDRSNNTATKSGSSNEPLLGSQQLPPGSQQLPQGTQPISTEELLQCIGELYLQIRIQQRIIANYQNPPPPPPPATTSATDSS